MKRQYTKGRRRRQAPSAAPAVANAVSDSSPGMGALASAVEERRTPSDEAARETARARRESERQLMPPPPSRAPTFAAPSSGPYPLQPARQPMAMPASAAVALDQAFLIAEKALREFYPLNHETSPIINLHFQRLQLVKQSMYADPQLASFAVREAHMALVDLHTRLAEREAAGPHAHFYPTQLQLNPPLAPSASAARPQSYSYTPPVAGYTASAASSSSFVALPAQDAMAVLLNANVIELERMLDLLKHAMDNQTYLNIKQLLYTPHKREAIEAIIAIHRRVLEAKQE